MAPVISFTSDFGLSDPYVGTVKAVMLAIAPDAIVVDVCHAIEPQAIAQAVFLAEQSWPYFADGTIHLAVVDPGVGTGRKAIALRTPFGFAIGPDNGVLSAAYPPGVRNDAAALLDGSSGANPTVRVALPPGFEARLIELPAPHGRAPSATFHGRDVFGPAAGSLAGGMPFSEVGPVCPDVAILPPFRPLSDGYSTVGTIVHVDRFGNLISTLRARDLPRKARSVEVAGLHIPLVRTYEEADGLCALIGSGGYLEVALTRGNAAGRLGLGVGSTVRVAAT